MRVVRSTDRTAVRAGFHDIRGGAPGAAHGTQGAVIAGRAAPKDTAERILDAAKDALLTGGYAVLSTRRIAESAGVPLSQIHYHFGSKRQLVLALLEAENARLLRRQSDMYAADQPLWKQWEQACDYLEDDLESGYVRVLQEMTAAGWSDEEVAAAVRGYLGGWLTLLRDVVERFAAQVGNLGVFEPREVAALVAAAFLGVESMVLLGFSEEQMPNRAALRKIGALIRAAERSGEDG